MQTFEIYFDDLNEDAKERYLEFLGMEDEADGNFELAPLALVDLETEEPILD